MWLSDHFVVPCHIECTHDIFRKKLIWRPCLNFSTFYFQLLLRHDLSKIHMSASVLFLISFRFSVAALKNKYKCDCQPNRALSKSSEGDTSSMVEVKLLRGCESSSFQLISSLKIFLRWNFRFFFSFQPIFGILPWFFSSFCACGLSHLWLLCN